MKIERPMEIKAEHLAKIAINYMRQSTQRQVLDNQGSTAHQRGQQEHALRYGWAESQIKVIDGDQGRSGASAVHRSGYQEMVEDVRADRVGAILVSDVSRAGREAIEWFIFLELCRVHNVRLIVNGAVYNLNESGPLFQTRLQGLCAELDNQTRRDMLVRGRIAKAKAGKAVSSPPTGYVRDNEGDWQLDPDPTVRAAIDAIIRIFLKERTLVRTVRALNRLGIKLPRRRITGRIDWVAPQNSTLAYLLKNPAYMGSYVFGRTVADPSRGRDRRGRWRSRRSRPDEMIVVAKHHDAYISAEQHDEIIATLKRNGPSEQHRNLGPGSGLLQGLPRCRQHSFRGMCTVYKGERQDGGRSHGYYCQGTYDHGGPQCGRIPGGPVDAAVVEAALRRLSPPRLEAVRQAWRQMRAGQRSEERRRELEVNRVRQRVADLRYRFEAVDAANRFVASDIETQLDAALRELRAAEDGTTERESPITQFNEESFAELLRLSQDLRALWTASTTANRDRKEILRTLIAQVIVEDRTLEKVCLRIVWADGAPDTPVEAMLNRHAHGVILKLASEGLGAAEISTRVNEMCIPTSKSRAWTKHTVAQFLRRHRG